MMLVNNAVNEYQFWNSRTFAQLTYSTVFQCKDRFKMIISEAQLKFGFNYSSNLIFYPSHKALYSYLASGGGNQSNRLLVIWIYDRVWIFCQKDTCILRSMYIFPIESLQHILLFWHLLYGILFLLSATSRLS